MKKLNKDKKLLFVANACSGTVSVLAAGLNPAVQTTITTAPPTRLMSMVARRPTTSAR